MTKELSTKIFKFNNKVYNPIAIIQLMRLIG